MFTAFLRTFYALAFILPITLCAQPGSLDLSFDPGVGPNALVNKVFPQADGKVIIVGSLHGSIRRTARRSRQIIGGRHD